MNYGFRIDIINTVAPPLTHTIVPVVDLITKNNFMPIHVQFRI